MVEEEEGGVAEVVTVVTITTVTIVAALIVEVAMEMVGGEDDIINLTILMTNALAINCKYLLTICLNNV